MALAFRLQAPELLIGRHVQLEGERLILGRNVRLFDSGQYLTATQGSIEIGDNSHISRFAVLSGLGGIKIGNGCSISAHVAIYSITSNTNAPIVIEAPNEKQPVRIGNNVYIGVGAKIIPGVTVGDNAVIGAGAVVTKDVPSNMLALGIPAIHKPLNKRRI